MIGGIVKEFREFALKGNVLDLAVAVVIGTAFGTVVNSMVSNIVMPIVGIAGKVSFEAWSFAIRGSEIRYGKFVTDCINFAIVAFALFIVIKAFNTIKKRLEAEKPAPPPPGPTVDQKLLTEIRDLLAKR